MNKLTWICIIVWGAFVGGFGLTGVGADGSDIAPQDVMFLVAGGTVTCLIGMIGLAGRMGLATRLRADQKSYL